MYFRLYRRGNCTKHSYLMCPLRGMKCPHLSFRVLLPKNFWAEKRSFPQRHLAILLQISRLELDTIDWKMTLHTAITPVHAYQIW